MNVEKEQIVDTFDWPLWTERVLAVLPEEK